MRIWLRHAEARLLFMLDIVTDQSSLLYGLLNWGEAYLTPAWSKGWHSGNSNQTINQSIITNYEEHQDLMNGHT
jgi:hypothetical protein